MVIDSSMCLGCDNCLKACKDEFEGSSYPGYSAAQQPVTYGFGSGQSFGWPTTPSTVTPWVVHGQNWMDVQEQVVGSYPAIKVVYTSMPCFHCDNAPCIAAATNNAIYRRADGIILIDPVKAVGQQGVVSSCPYGRIYWNASANIPQKCTFCAHLVDQGKNPRCVDACPESVITFGDLDDPTSKVSMMLASNVTYVMSPALGTEPNVHYVGLPQPFLTGKVVDSDGNFIAGATVSITGPNSYSSQDTTDIFADYEFDELVLNQSYTISASATGYATNSTTITLAQAGSIGNITLATSTTTSISTTT